MISSEPNVRQVCFYLTRRCNLSCDYCKVIKYRRTELDTSRVKEALQTIKDYLKPEITILFGGEPTIRKDIGEIIKFCNKIDLEYALISNSVNENFNGFENLRNYTASIDTLKGNGNGDIEKKSMAGLKMLIEAKKIGIPDVVGNIIISRENYLEVPSIVQFLDHRDIWSIVGIVHSGKEDFWRFRNYCPHLTLSENRASHVSKELLELYDNGALIHNAREYLVNLPELSRLEWHCRDMPNFQYLNIDEDGSFLPCGDWWGREEMRKFTIFNCEDVGWEDIESTWRREIEGCPGCAYNHMLNLWYKRKLRHRGRELW